MNTLRYKIGMILGMAIASQAGAADRRVEAHHFIVQAQTTAEARRDVRAVGGAVRRELAIVRAVEADLTQTQEVGIRKIHGVQLYGDAAIATQGSGSGSSLQQMAANFVSSSSSSITLTDGTGVAVPSYSTPPPTQCWSERMHFRRRVSPARASPSP